MFSTSNVAFEEFLRYPFDISYPPIHGLVYTVSSLSSFILTYCNITIRMCFYSCCTHLITLYSQLQRQALQLNEQSVDQREVVKKFVNFHLQIKEIVGAIIEEYHSILLMDAIFSTVVFGLILFNFSFSLKFLRLMAYCFSTVYAMWLFCNGGNIVAEQSRQMAYNLYTQIDWCNIKPLSLRRSMIIMMLDFQRPIHVKLLKLKVVDLELSFS